MFSKPGVGWVTVIWTAFACALGCGTTQATPPTPDAGAGGPSREVTVDASTGDGGAVAGCACTPGQSQACGAGGKASCGTDCQWGSCECPTGELACGAPVACSSPTDVHSCGTCANDCTQLSLVGTTGLACTAGRCTYQCAAMQADCTGNGLGCSTSLATPMNCGTCGHDCTGLLHVAGPTSCGGAACAFPASSCAPGWADCDGDPSDGCETNLSQAANCGACGQACTSAAPVCSATGSTFACASGCLSASLTVCGTSCVDTTMDADNCGSCSHACTASVLHAQPNCAASGCTFTCNSGYAACAGACVDTTSDANNCGTCGHACSSGSVCQNSQCTCTGLASQTCGDCGTQTRTCTSGAWSSWSACTGQGACATAATQPCGMNATETCTNACQWGPCGCAGSDTLCGGACVDETSDPANCGACGATCPGKCFMGSCTKAVAVAAGDGFVCAAISDGTVRCWGDNEYGQLGNGLGDTGDDSENSSTPVEVSTITNAVTVFAGGGRACALLSDTTVACWGQETNGTGVDDSNLYDSNVPVPVYLSADVGPYVSLTNVTSMALGGEHMCALLTDGSVQCWGSNDWGQLGNGSTTDSAVPVSAGITGVKSLAAGSNHTCAVKAGNMWCWGSNSFGNMISGQLGSATLTYSATPIVAFGAQVLAAGGYESCGLLPADEEVDCWGWAGYDVVGNNTCNDCPSPTVVPGVGGAQLAIDSDHACAIQGGGVLECWGNNNMGEIGTGTTSYASVAPTINGVLHVTQITVGGGFSCALLQDGSITCWGDGGAGQLGSGGTAVNPTPTPVTVTW